MSTLSSPLKRRTRIMLNCWILFVFCCWIKASFQRSLGDGLPSRESKASSSFSERNGSLSSSLSGFNRGTCVECVFVSVCLNVCVCVYLCVCIHVDVWLCVYVSASVCEFLHNCVRVCVFVWVFMGKRRKKNNIQSAIASHAAFYPTCSRLMAIAL